MPFTGARRILCFAPRSLIIRHSLVGDLRSPPHPCINNAPIFMSRRWQLLETDLMGPGHLSLIGSLSIKKYWY